jgi:hypothetical protein
MKIAYADPLNQLTSAFGYLNYLERIQTMNLLTYSPAQEL